MDFATPDGKTLAISLSEKNLDGRRLLIKDGKYQSFPNTELSLVEEAN